jgi:drug/metabolite transporter (DMT)-like permease
MRATVLALAALMGFSANSLLTRAALASGELHAPAFALIRVATGALVLALLTRTRDRRRDLERRSWTGAVSLSIYLLAFTVAYTRIGAAIGALLLFGAVQVSMIASGLTRGERPHRAEVLGGALAAAGLLWLTLPGATSPGVSGATLMILAGTAWGVYSIDGRRSRDPLADTARNFARATLLVGAPLLWLAWPPHGSLHGVALAAASGALASGVGYTLWYAALPSLTIWRAATVQLAVPLVTAIAAAALLGEALTARIGIAALLIVIGVLLTTSARAPRRA